MNDAEPARPSLPQWTRRRTRNEASPGHTTARSARPRTHDETALLIDAQSDVTHGPALRAPRPHQVTLPARDRGALRSRLCQRAHNGSRLALAADLRAAALREVSRERRDAAAPLLCAPVGRRRGHRRPITLRLGGRQAGRRRPLGRPPRVHDLGRPRAGHRRAAAHGRRVHERARAAGLAPLGRRRPRRPRRQPTAARSQDGHAVHGLRPPCASLGDANSLSARRATRAARLSLTRPCPCAPTTAAAPQTRARRRRSL